MRKRAYTHITRSLVRIGNAWLERQWSAFLGTTQAFIDQPASMEWIQGQSREWLVSINGESLSPLSCGELEWTEGNTAFGAMLEACWSTPTSVLRVQTTVPHRWPAMIRQFMVYNTTEAPIQVGPITVDALSFHGSAWTSLPCPENMPISCVLFTTTGNSRGLLCACPPGTTIARKNSETAFTLSEYCISVEPGTRTILEPFFYFTYPVPWDERAACHFLDFLSDWQEVQADE